MHTFITQQAASAALQLIVFILLSCAAACVPWLYTHVKNRALAGALAWLINVAAIAVGAGASSVRDLKDPTRPGLWTPEAAARFRNAAVASVMELGRGALDVVRRTQGLSAAGAEQLVEQLVEAAVEQGRRGQGLPVPVPSVLRGPTMPSRVPGSPPPLAAAAAPRAGERGRASLGALLGLVVVAVVACGCSGGAAATLTAAADTASTVVLVARKVRAALCAEQLDPYLGPVRERVVVVHDVAVDAGAADGAVDAGSVE